MTEKLYYTDSHIFNFTANVIGICEIDKKTAVILDKTAFFSGGGGQPCDTGEIGACTVTEVFEKDGIIYHIIGGKSDFNIGDSVECCLDKELRFYRMQAHSGEHIFSGVAHSLFGVDNVGFHMTDLILTVDFNSYLTKEQIALIEEKTNDVIYSDVRITAEFVDDDKLNSLQYRSKLELTENVRLVTIENCDCCACCAPHVSSTGEVGIVKVLNSISHRGGVRINLICGKTAFENYKSEHSDVMQISDLLKVPNTATVDGVNDVLLRLNEAKYKENDIRKKLYSYIYNSLSETEKCIVLFPDDFTPNELRELAQICKGKTKKIFAAFSGDDFSGYSFALSSDNVKLKSLSKNICNALSAKGGGGDEMIQGRSNALHDEITEFFEHFNG